MRFFTPSRRRNTVCREGDEASPQVISDVDAIMIGSSGRPMGQFSLQSDEYLRPVAAVRPSHKAVTQTAGLRPKPARYPGRTSRPLATKGQSVFYVSPALCGELSASFFSSAPRGSDTEKVVSVSLDRVSIAPRWALAISLAIYNPSPRLPIRSSSP